MKILYVNANIITAETGSPARAMLVDGSMIGALYSEAHPHEAGVDETVDLAGATILPGLIDSHGHIFWTGLRHMRLQLGDCASEEAMVKKVVAFAAGKPRGTWISGEGWDQNLWSSQYRGDASALPDHQLLSLNLPENPVFLYRVDGHAALINRSALVCAGITRETPDPPGGHIVRDNQDEPTGILLENAMDLVARHLPPMTPGDKKKALGLALAELAQEGVTCFHECGADEQEIEILHEFAESGQLTCRMHVMFDGGKKDLREKFFGQGPTFDDGRALLQVRAVKLFADGALGSRGALLHEEYADAPGISGVPVMREGEICDITIAALQKGFQVATHAIGDLAGEICLNAYQRALETLGHSGDYRLRIEHAQMTSSTDIERYARLGVVASVQCCHCTSDMPWALARLGKERLAGKAYRWRSFVDAGVPICNGSDSPVEPPRPFWGMHAAVTRRGRVEGGRGPDCSGDSPGEVLTPPEALAAMTSTAAWAAFWESKVGSLAVGKLADFIEIDRDPLKISPDEIHEIKVLRTWFGGRQIFTRAASKGTGERSL